MKKFETRKSKNMFEETKKYLVDGVASSFQKSQYEEYPICIERGKGSKVYDIDGNEYIDYIGAFGPMLLGFNPEVINMSVSKQLEKGSQFAATTYDLYRLSKKLTEIIPCAEKISFQSSGTEANMHAFRIARAYTGKRKIIKFEGQYHGWSDEEKVTIDAGSIDELGPRENPNKILHSKGQRNEAVDDIIILPWNDLEILEKVLKDNFKEIAAIITEPIMFDSGPILPQVGYLEGLRELSTKYNIILIFDEVITGFRVALGGAQEYYKITPDISVFAKAIASGYPLSAVAGRKEIMDSGVHASGTFNANPISVAAALATIETLENKKVYEKFDALGERLVNGIRELGEKYKIKLFSCNVRSICILIFGMDTSPKDFRDYIENADIHFYEDFVNRAKEYGIRFTSRRGRLYLSTEHTEEDIEKTLQVVNQIFYEIQN
ncbi:MULTISPECIES: aspartate aminotransferase family protein [unclassified Clostridium]|uniref:aspartate aminotransferase family protein n=1 Tax=unclassified Clostridium TaxID=2614128 RepID=UPI00029769C9|nr:MULTISPECIES: aspartate aminotransferase family protein [unclassified Clostridium]EKQ50944.1 MAG: glutamate-1-semialdehyde aminotransferase [Clostridium sp. Maddingley MBC34-26]